MTKGFEKHFRIKINEIKTWCFSHHVTIIKYKLIMVCWVKVQLWTLHSSKTSYLNFSHSFAYPHLIYSNVLSHSMFSIQHYPMHYNLHLIMVTHQRRRNITYFVKVITGFQVINKQKKIFQRLTKLNEPIRRVQFGVLKIYKCLGIYSKLHKNNKLLAIKDYVVDNNK